MEYVILLAKRQAMSSPSMLPENTLQQIPASAIQMDELIGQGSYGDVYCGRWNGRVVAIKQLHLKKLPAHLTADFENETKIMAECQCEQIVRLFGVSIDSNQYAMVMEYMEKGSLYQALHNPDFNVSWPLRWQIAEDVGKGLAYLHQKEIVHRDLKSLNILLDRNLRAKISDFGLSKVKSETGSTTTQAKAPGGTVRWRAPELFKRKAVHTKASDVYSYSMVLFEIASRKIPFSEASDEITVINWLNQGEQEDIPSDCPEAYAALIKRGWSLQPEQRPAIQEILQKISEAKPQNAILASIEKAWHFDLDSKPQAYLQGKKYELIPASDKDAQKVLQFYAHHPVPGYGLSSVKLIYNPSFNRIFSLHMGKLQERDKNPAFSPKWLLDSNPPWRKKVDELFHALAKPYVDSDCPAVRLLPMWHGTDPEILDSIFRAGYANLATTDSGFFGKGYYSTFEAEYAFRVYGKGALLLNWVAVFSPYPVVEGDNQKLAGKANFQNYDAHFIPVSPKDPHNPHEVNYLPSPPFQAHTYTELVVFESAAMLPRYLVELQPTMLKSPSVMRSSPEPPPQASKPLFMRQAATKLSPAKKGSHLSDHRKLTSSSEVSPKPATPQLLPSASFNDDLSSPLPLRKSGGTYELKYEIEVGCDVSYLAALPTGLVACTMHNSLDTQFRLHDHVISILHPITGQCFNTLKGHQDRIYALTPLPGGMLASGCRDATVKIWNPAGKLLKAVLKEGGALSSVLLVLRNGNLACGGKDKKISLWNPASRELISQLEGHGGKITALVELPNGSLASGSVDGVIKIWNLDTKAVRTLEGHKGKVTALVGLPKGILASASADKTIKLWNPISSELLRTFEGHSEAVKALLAMPNGSLCSGSLDKTIRLWNPITGAVRTLKGHGAAVISLAHLPENAFCSLSKDNKIKIWNEKGEERSTIDEKGHVAMLTTFPDGKILAGGKSLNQWDSSTGELLLSIDPINAAALAVFADGNFATATKDKIISLWDIRAKPLLHTCEGHSSSVLALTTLEDGTLVSGSADTSMIFWNPTTGKLLRTVKGHKASVSALVALPNKKLASGSQDNTIKIWNTANGELLVTLVGHTSPINALATLPHDMLASASLEEIIIWNPTTKEQLRKIDMPEVFVLVSLPEGLLAAANAEFCAIWDPVTGRCIQKLDHDGDSYSSFLSLAAFPDGTLIAGFNDNLICTWQ